MGERRRKAKFSVYEIDVLVDEVYRNRAILFSKPYTQASNERKLDLWKSIARRVNEVCTVRHRTLDEVRKKWYYYWYAKKKEITKRKEKIEHGTMEDLFTPTDMKMFEMLDEYGENAKMTDQDEVDDPSVPPTHAADSVDKELRYSESCVSLSLDEDEMFSDDETSPTPSPNINVSSATLSERYVKSEPDVRIITVNAEMKTELSPGVMEDSLRSKAEPQLRVLTFSPPSTPSQRARSRSSKQRRRPDGTFQKNKEFLRLEKRRVELQQQQLKTLQDIHKQMQVDSEKNSVFQREFLEILRQGLQMASSKGASMKKHSE